MALRAIYRLPLRRQFLLTSSFIPYLYKDFYFYFTCMGVLPTYMFVLCTSMIPWETEESIESSGTGSEIPCGCWEPHLGPLEEWQKLITAESSLQPQDHSRFLFLVFFFFYSIYLSSNGFRNCFFSLTFLILPGEMCVMAMPGHLPWSPHTLRGWPKERIVTMTPQWGKEINDGRRCCSKSEDGIVSSYSLVFS